MCGGPQNTEPALPDPLMRHWAFLGPSEQGAITDKPQAPGSQPTGGRPSHTATEHLATPRASVAQDWPTHKQVETVAGNAGALPLRLLCMSSYATFHRTPGHLGLCPQAVFLTSP